MNRREFLKRLGGGMAGTAVAIAALPSAVDLLKRLLRRPDYNEWPAGLTDCLSSTSVHGLHTSTVPQWKAGYTASMDFPFQYVVLRRPRPRAEAFAAWERRVLA